MICPATTSWVVLSAPPVVEPLFPILQMAYNHWPTLYKYITSACNRYDMICPATTSWVVLSAPPVVEPLFPILQMGSPVSATVANLCMEVIEEQAIRDANSPPKVWKR